MKHRLHRNLLLFTFIVLCLPIIRCQKTPPYDVCGQSGRCGSIKLEYPFWGLGRPSYCGHSGFQLTCQSNVPILNYESINYRVLDMDTSTQMITVARNDLWTDFCPELLYNTTYDSMLFDQNNLSQQDFSLFYGCNNSEVPLPFRNNYQFTCNVNGTVSDGFFFRTDLVAPSNLVSCENFITVPVSSSYASRLGSGSASTDDLTLALRAGFNLSWTVNSGECDRCTLSGGRCGSNTTSPESFACFCASGNFSLTCNNTNVNEGKRFPDIVVSFIALIISHLLGFYYIYFHLNG